MTILKVLSVPDDRLTIKANPVPAVTDHVRAILDNMVDTMHAENGCGLAAVQVDIPLRLVVVDLGDDVIYKMCNPMIRWHSKNIIMSEEGCLSVPRQVAIVPRFEAIHIDYLNENGQRCTLKTGDFLAICLQHEMDHLDGKLYIDYLDPKDRQQLIDNVTHCGINDLQCRL